MRTNWPGFRSILADRIEQFLTYKRALGRRYDVEEGALRLLDRYLLGKKVMHQSQVTPEVLESFLASRPRHRPRSYNHLLCTLRRLFNWLVIQGALDRSPVQTKPKRQTSQRIPFIFDRSAARRLLELAATLPDNTRASGRGVTYRTIFAVLYGLGLRVGEVCRLRLRDVDLHRQVLIIRQTKFRKNRLVPFGPRMAALLREYHQTRAGQVEALSPDAPVFTFTARGEISPCTVSQTFHALVPRLGLAIPSGCSPPRLHDLRHSFAVGTLLRWYRSGADPGAGLLKLATFMGHVNASSTAVYLTITRELLHEANRRFEAFAGPAISKEMPQ